MLVIHCALPCEAIPIISRLSLKPDHEIKVPVWKNDQILLVQSGVGYTRTVFALGSLAGKYDVSGSFFLNIGIAGHSSYEVGESFWVHSIESDSTEQRFYPLFLKKVKHKTSHLKTVIKPNFDYPQDTGLDMEAMAFFEAAYFLTSREHAHCLKVVSDNPLVNQRPSKIQVSEWIEKAWIENEKLIFQLADLALNKIQSTSRSFEGLTVSQNRLMNQLIKRAQVFGLSLPAVTNSKDFKQQYPKLLELVDQQSFLRL